MSSVRSLVARTKSPVSLLAGVNQCEVTERTPSAAVKISSKSIWVVSTDGAWLSAATTEDWKNYRRIVGVDGLITVGPLSRHLALGAKEGGMTSVFSYDTCEEAAEKLAALAKAGDAVLVKGSHYMHMEKVPMLLRGVLTKDGK